MFISGLWNRTTLLQGMTFLTGIVLILEAFLQFRKGSSLCPVSGCRIAGDALRISEPLLVSIGAGFFLCLAVMFGLARWMKSEWAWWGTAIVLFGALSFDGVLLGHQFVGMEERCLLCILVGVCLGLILLLFAWARRSRLIPVLGLAVFSGGFLGNAVLDGAGPDSFSLPSLDETAFVQKASALESPPKMYLYFSFHCLHCTYVFANLAVNESRQAEWHLATADSSRKDLLRLAEIKKRVEGGENPFIAVLETKNQKELSGGEVPKEIIRAVENARVYIRGSQYHSVPLLFAEEGRGRQVISVGAKNIMSYLAARGIITRPVNFRDRKAPAGSGT